jgi:hypothetical protein
LKRDSKIEIEIKKSEEQKQHLTEENWEKIQSEQRIKKLSEKKAIRKIKIDNSIHNNKKNNLINKKVISNLKKMSNNDKKSDSISNNLKKDISIKAKTINTESLRSFNKKNSDSNNFIFIENTSNKNNHKKEILDDISFISNDEKTKKLAGMFHEFIEQSLNAEFSSDKNLYIINNETSTPKDSSLNEIIKEDSLILKVNEKNKMGNKKNKFSKSSKKSNSENVINNAKGDTIIRVPINSKEEIQKEKFIEQQNSEKRVEKIATLLNEFITKTETSQENEVKDTKLIKKFDDILLKGEAILKSIKKKGEYNELKINEISLNETNQTIVSEKKYEIVEKNQMKAEEKFEKSLNSDDEFWQIDRINSAEEEARKDRENSARLRSLKEKAERKIDEERARQKAIEEAAIKSPFLLRRRAGAYGIKQIMNSKTNE